MILERIIIRSLERQCGRKIKCSADCEYLAYDIESLIGEHIGVNTIKRLLGFINDERTPRSTTLNIIARYLGSKDWEQLQDLKYVYASSSFIGMSKEIIVSNLKPGFRIRIMYFPQRIVDIKYLGDCQFIVLKSENSKLRRGDRLILTNIINQHPLWVSNVIRDGESLGSFSTGESPITYRYLRVSG